MAIWIYSVEGFPGTRESGRHTEYCEMYGLTIILKPKEWTKLDGNEDGLFKGKYVRYFWKDSIQRGPKSTNDARPTAVREVFLAEELADAIIMKYGGIGLAKLDCSTPYSPENKSTAMQLESQALEQNKRYRASIVARFNDERKARQLTGRGRLEPSAYELDCHRVLGLPVPGTLDEIKAERGTTEVKVELPPELIDLIHDGISSRRAAAEQVPKKA